MGVIGIVAALTLPNLNSSTGDKEKVVKLKKIYSNLNDALGRAQAVYGPLDEWVRTDETLSFPAFILNRISDFMKTTKICLSNYTTNCSLKLAENGGSKDISNYVIVADGALINFYSYRETGFGIVNIDIDGTKKGANKDGIDVFSFYYSKNGVYVDEDFINNDSKYVSKSTYYNAFDAAAWIINFGNMYYLKTTDGTTCPNGTKLTVGGNHSCK